MEEKPGPERLADKIDLDKIDSVALRRLIEEVRNNEPGELTGYNRVYHRHNR